MDHVCVKLTGDPAGVELAAKLLGDRFEILEGAVTGSGNFRKGNFRLRQLAEAATRASTPNAGATTPDVAGATTPDEEIELFTSA